MTWKANKINNEHEQDTRYKIQEALFFVEYIYNI